MTLADGELDFLAFSKCAEPSTHDGPEVHEKIITIFTLNEAITLSFVEPLHGTSLTIGH